MGKVLNVSVVAAAEEEEAELDGGATAGQQLSLIGLKIPQPSPPPSELHSCVELELSFCHPCVDAVIRRHRAGVRYWASSTAVRLTL